MKQRLILILLMLVGALLLIALPSRQVRATTTTLTGTIVDPQGNAHNGTVTMRLPVPAQDIASHTAILPINVTYKVVNGVIQSGPPLYDVAGLQPTNLYYIAKFYDNAGNLVMGANYIVTGASFNLGAATPTSVTTSNISFVTPVTTSNPNSFTAAQTFSTIISSSNVPAATGFIRSANADQWCFRNVNNNGDLCITTGGSPGNDTINVLGINLNQNTIQPNTGSNLTIKTATVGLVGGPGISLTPADAANGTNLPGGNVIAAAGGGHGSGNGGDIIITGGAAGASGNPGNLVITGRTFANLGTPPSGNGSFIYCSDCTIANPCASGGTGALAKRLNGQWVCN